MSAAIASDNRWLEWRVLCHAHQAGAKEAPSSTLYAIEQALGAGADAIELDVHATADGVLVVCHDATLDATTNGSGPISEQSFAEIAELDAAWNFIPGRGACPGGDPSSYPLRGRAATDPALRVPSLGAVLEATRGVPLNLDVKRTAPQVPPYEAALVDVLREHERTGDVIVASFHEAAIATVHALAPEIAISPQRRGIAAFALATRLGIEPASWLRRYAALQVPPTVRGLRLVNRRFVDAAHRHGLAVHVWTIDDPAEMERVLDDGVDGVMTDVPSVLDAVMRAKSCPRTATTRKKRG